MEQTPQTDPARRQAQRPDAARGPDRGLDRFLPRWAQIAVAQALVLIVAGGLVHVPFHSISPGQTRDVLAEIDISGTRTYPSEGQLLLTTASVSPAPLTAWEGLAVWLSPTFAGIPRSYLVPPGSNDRDVDLDNRHDIEQSKITATVAALRALGRKVPVADGAAVVLVLEDVPADGVVRAGDRIVAVDGQRTDTPRAVSDAIAAREGGAAVELTVIRRGRERVLTMTTRASDGRATIGITLGPAYELPADVAIETGEIVGPSAGLVFALAIADALVREDLTRGHVIGVTGTIELDEQGRGVVGPIGGVGEKIRGAHRDGATIFLAPRAEAPEARRLAPGGMRVIGVETLSGALAALRRVPAA